AHFGASLDCHEGGRLKAVANPPARAAGGYLVEARNEARRARDGGVPGSRYLARVSPRFSSPHWAGWVCAVAALGTDLWRPVCSAMVALSTLALYASYAVPIGPGLWARSSGRWTERGPWDLGRWSSWVNAVALAWVAVITVLFVLPPNELAGFTF